MDSPQRHTGWIWAIGVILLVGGIVALGWWMRRPDTAEGTVAAATQPAHVRIGQDYYLFVRLVEFKPTKPNGSRWDSGNDSAPDPSVTLYWRNNRIFKLPTRTDQFIATWDLFRVDVTQLLTNGGKIDIASSINAPLVKIEPNQSVTAEIIDDDPMFSDAALKLNIPLDSLHVGQNEITPAGNSGVSRVLIELIDRQTPLPELIDLASKRK